MNGTTAVDWSYAGNGVVSTGLISGLWTTSGMPSSYLGVNLSASELANDAAVTVTHINYGSETAIAVTGSGFLSGSNPFVKTTTEGTDIAYLNTMAIDSTGTIIGTYTDGSTYELGQLGVALIPSNAGLKALGNDSWIETDKSGVPVIAPNSGGPTDLVKHGWTGFLIDTSNSYSLNHSVNQILNSSEHKLMSERARESVIHRTWELVNSQLIANYQDLVLGQAQLDERVA
jgi:hypothetical protein